MSDAPAPLKIIRAKCLSCCLSSAPEVRNCSAASCPLHPFRMGKNPAALKGRASAPARAIRKKCRECDPEKLCDAAYDDCPLWDFTHTRKKRRTLSEAERQRRADKLREINARKIQPGLI